MYVYRFEHCIGPLLCYKSSLGFLADWLVYYIACSATWSFTDNRAFQSGCLFRYIGAYHFSVEDLITPQFNHMVDTGGIRTHGVLHAMQTFYH